MYKYQYNGVEIYAIHDPAADEYMVYYGVEGKPEMELYGFVKKEIVEDKELMTNLVKYRHVLDSSVYINGKGQCVSLVNRHLGYKLNVMVVGGQAIDIENMDDCEIELGNEFIVDCKPFGDMAQITKKINRRF